MRTTSKQFAQSQNNGGKFVAPERKVLHQFIRYIKVQYPSILFYFDYGADALLTGRQAKERKDLSCLQGWPEIHIVEARHGHAGMFLDLKREDVSIYNRKGMFASEHLQQQNEVMERLRARGYYCAFAKGFEAARKYLDWYLDEKRPSLIKP